MISRIEPLLLLLRFVESLGPTRLLCDLFHIAWFLRRNFGFLSRSILDKVKNSYWIFFTRWLLHFEVFLKTCDAVFFAVVDPLRLAGFLNIFLVILGFLAGWPFSSEGLADLFLCRIFGPEWEGSPLIFGSAFAPLNSGTGIPSKGSATATCWGLSWLFFLPLLTFSRLLATRCSLALIAARFSTLNSTIGRYHVTQTFIKSCASPLWKRS